ncbi:MAG: YicC family protein [Tissierellia bacterium]|nr:YicC family protein [Tissierellia bacterium]
MIKSMTGYGRGESLQGSYRIKIEIKAVNHRYNDISVKMPRHINYLEESIKKLVKEKISRGKVDVYLNLEYIDESAVEVKVDIPLAKSFKTALEELIEALNLKDEIRLNNILNISEVMRTERKELDEDLIWNCVSEAVGIALDNMMIMREKEGAQLKADIITKLENINASLFYIVERAPYVVVEYQEKLKERITDLIHNSISLDEDKINSEVAFFADKSSIDEEIVRLHSHIKQFYTILEEKEPIGRKLDFLIQELNREINTIGSKANDVVISKYVVELKSELEKIREQIQNIE